MRVVTCHSALVGRWCRIKQFHASKGVLSHWKLDSTMDEGEGCFTFKLEAQTAGEAVDWGRSVRLAAPSVGALTKCMIKRLTNWSSSNHIMFLVTTSHMT